MTIKKLITSISFSIFSITAFAQSIPDGYVTLEAYNPKLSNVKLEYKRAAQFEAVKGASLRQTLEQWTRNAGWQELSWGLPDDMDFTLGANAKFEGDFITALRSFINALGPEAQVKVRFIHSNKLVIVEPLQ